MALCVMAGAALPGCEASETREDARASTTLSDTGEAQAATRAGDEVDRSDEDPTGYAWPEGPHPTVTIAVEGRGEIVIELYPELAPKTVANFVKLAHNGLYDGTTFHRVIPNFMLQGGDPDTRDDLPGNDGYGGPGYTIEDEINGAPHIPGVVSMANKGRPNSGGSQFFIMLAEAPTLDDKHTVFGRVIAGQSVLEAISEVETDEYGRWGPKARPIEDVVLERFVVSEPEEQMAGG
jgi:cyclophilin family peptidyl-prolyl cis-trans isomerase